MQNAGIRSIEELANKSGVTRAAIYHYLNGQRQPSVDTFRSICKVLNVDAEKAMKEVTVVLKLGRPDLATTKRRR